MPKKYKQTAIRATEIQQQESDWGTMCRAVQLSGRGRASAALHGIMINVIWLHFDMHHNGQQSECHSFAFPKTIDSTPLPCSATATIMPTTFGNIIICSVAGYVCLQQHGNAVSIRTECSRSA